MLWPKQQNWRSPKTPKPNPKLFWLNTTPHTAKKHLSKSIHGHETVATPPRIRSTAHYKELYGRRYLGIVKKEKGRGRRVRLRGAEKNCSGKMSRAPSRTRTEGRAMGYCSICELHRRAAAHGALRTRSLQSSWGGLTESLQI